MHLDLVAKIPLLLLRNTSYNNIYKGELSKMSNLIKPYTRRVHFYETDQMGIVHHSNYIRWYEEARTDFMKQVDLDYKVLGSMGIDIPVLSFSCVHKKSVRFDDLIYIKTKATSFNGVRLFFEYELRFCDDDALSATGESSHCFLNKEMSPMNLKKSFPEIYNRIKTLIEQNN